jgi:hypothetical protein
MMVTRTRVDIEAIARLFNTVQHGVAGIRELRARQSDKTLELWLITENISLDDERRLYQIGVDLMGDDPSIDFHVLSARYFVPGTNLSALVPADAERLPLT